MQTTWSSGGMRREVTTLRLEGESTKDWRERHFEAVRVAQAIHPPE